MCLVFVQLGYGVGLLEENILDLRLFVLFMQQNVLIVCLLYVGNCGVEI